MNVPWEGAICDNHYSVAGGNGKAMTLLWADGGLVDHKSLRLQYGSTYRFDAGNVTVSVHDKKKSNSEPLALPGNDCGCAKKGPLLFTPEKVMGLEKKFYLKLSTGEKLNIKMCTDSKSFKFGKKKKKCKKLKKSHCDKWDKTSGKLVRNYCNDLCENCDNGRLSKRCQDDPEFLFEKKNSKLSCRELSKKKCDKKDKEKRLMREYCKEKCNFCQSDP